MFSMSHHMQETPRLSFRAPSTHAEVNDVRWHPTRPGVFASVLGNGRAELWDVRHSVLEPVAVYLKEGNRKLYFTLAGWPAYCSQLPYYEYAPTPNTVAASRHYAQVPA